MKLKISVIVPIYRVEKYLKKCIDSILNQTYKNIEVILVNDGSPDRCGEICNKYAQLDKRIKVIHKENGGLSSARNAGLRIASGDYVSFVDSDDWIEPHMYEILIKNVIDYDAQISCGGVSDLLEQEDLYSIIKSTFNGNVEVYLDNKEEAIKRFLSSPWAAWGKLYHRSIHQDIFFPEGEINEDEAIALSLLQRCDKVVYTNESLYNYIKHPNSITTTSFSRNKLDWHKHCKQDLEFIEKKYINLVEYAHERYIRSIMWSIRSMISSKDNFELEISSFIQELKKNSKKIRDNQLICSKEKFWINILIYGSIFNRGTIFKILFTLNLKRYGGDYNK